jgi:hypothetical protein
MARPKISIDEGQVEELAVVGCSVEEVASLITPLGSKRAVDHRTIERRFAPALKKSSQSRRDAQERTCPSRDGWGHHGADFFLCKTIPRMQKPLCETNQP